jgi:hypothetical protein
MTISDSLIVRTYLLRGAVLWLLARVLISAVIFAAQGDPFAFSSRSAVIIIAVSTAVAFAQTIRYRERAFLGNLGVTRASLAACYALPALLGELAIALLGRALT